MITDWRDVYYFTGVILDRAYPRALVVEPGGKTTLVVEGEYPEALADQHLEEMTKAGVSCRVVFDAMKQMQDQIKEGALVHHGGHGTGLRAHTYPRINPYFDDIFEASNVITIEPGVYGEELRGRIRLEYNYLVTEEGVERLNEFPISIPGGSSF